MIDNIKDRELFDIKKVGIISIMVWFLLNVLAIPLSFSMIISLFGKTWLSGNNYFIENEVGYFTFLISSILAVLSVSYYYSKGKVKALSGYLLKITSMLLISKIALYVISVYYPAYISLLGISNGFICYVVFMAMFIKISELYGKKLSFLDRIKIIALSLLIYLAITYPLYWGIYTFITEDYFTYPSDYWHFEKFIFFIYVLGALISVPSSTYIYSKLTNLGDLKKYSLEMLKYSIVFSVITLISFWAFTLYYHHVFSIGSFIVWLIIYSLIMIFKMLDIER
ncbi:hypothetical protein [Methanotorris igneus]|uniref:Uncharacterized protein n=1 Tax=Methanotorris igneus (strain DSM 5666 / JCM 11834 / Kol 5) TaxID=880724 RepID=F6BDQ3_METIK|nr:hypothetical protein [Methanotorris igneus]AEF96614.1 hypothetical protein Metig_1075 [Methanotorris igneus Kol 5]